MATDDFLSPDQLSHVDAHSMADLGRIDLEHTTGATASETVGDELIIAMDSQHNGYADTLKVLDPDGAYSSWEYRNDADGAHWVETDHGNLDGGGALA